MTTHKKRKRAIRASAAESGRAYQSAHNVNRLNVPRLAEPRPAEPQPSVPRLNLAQNPSVEALRALLASCDDERAHHVPWVDRDGVVHIDPLPERSPPAMGTSGPRPRRTTGGSSASFGI